jgi:ankyrin repeat protein
VHTQGVTKSVTFCVDDASYEMDRDACIAASPYFRALLTGPMRESQLDRIPIQPPSPAAFAAVVDYLTRKAIPNLADALPVLANADYLMLDTLRDPLVRQLGVQAWTILETPAARALEASDPEVAAHILFVFDRLGRTAMHHAAAAASFRSATILLNAGADPMARDASRRVPLHYAADSSAWHWWSDFIGQTDRLLGNVDRDLAWTAQDIFGRSPMHVLIQRGKLRWARQVIQSLSQTALGALAHQADHKGNTLLNATMRAPGGPDWGVVDALLDAGADPFAVNARGETAAHGVARHGPSASFVAFIIMVRNRLGLATCTRLVRAQDADGRTPLHILAEVGGTLGILQPSRKILGLQDTAGDTALHIAITQARGVSVHRQAPCFHQLWKASPRDIRNADGLTARQLAGSLGVWVP